MDEDEIRVKTAFDLRQLPEDVDLTVPPTSGFDYLYRVRLETRQCPQVVVANIDTTKFRERQTVTIDVSNGFVRAPPGFQPQPTWRHDALDTFKEAKARVAAHREDVDMQGTQSKHPGSTPVKRSDLPKMTKDEEWCEFCLGSDVRRRVYGGGSDSETEGSDGPSSKRTRVETEGNPPLLSVVVFLSQRMVIRLLSYHISWLDKLGFSHPQGKWLYALLVQLDKPLEPGVCALLRTLSRACSRLREELSGVGDPLLRPLNLILCIVSDYFEQKDMSDEFVRE